MLHCILHVYTHTVWLSQVLLEPYEYLSRQPGKGIRERMVIGKVGCVLFFSFSCDCLYLLFTAVAVSLCSLSLSLGPFAHSPHCTHCTHAAFNRWLKVPKEKLKPVLEIIQMLHHASLM